MNRFPAPFILLTLGAMLLSGCARPTPDPTPATDPSEEAQIAAYDAYSTLLFGDMSLLADGQTDTWWIPNFQSKDVSYEYAYLDLDQDGFPELLVQGKDDPGSYNGVFHYENGELFCWQSDGTEMSSQEYPLEDGTMVSQYEYNGTCSYTLFSYLPDGQRKELSHLFVRKEKIPSDSPEPCPYYEIDGKQVDQDVFEAQLKSRITDRLLDPSGWTWV